MRILAFGAGNIGSIYAGLLFKAGHQVSILARGSRLEHLRAHGIELESFSTGQRTTARPRVVERLAPDDRYDLILVALGRAHIAEALPELAKNRDTPSIMFFSNNAAGPETMTHALGKERVLLGFPGTAGIPVGDAIRYVIMSAQEQPTTIGELDGSISPRIKEIAEVLRSAGFSAAISRRMDAWLKTHAAEILPTACALYMTAGDLQRLARTRDAQVLMARAIREGYSVLRANNIPIEPRKHRIFPWLPEPLLVALMKRITQNKAAPIKVGHGLAAREEMALLFEDFTALAKKTSVKTPAIQRLARYIDPNTKPIADGSRSLPLKWSPA